MAATCWQTASISGDRPAMYSNRVCSAASRWLRVRMWLPPVVLEVPQEPHHPVEGEVAEGQPGDLAALVRRGEHEQQPDGVAVAAHRGRAAGP